MNIAASILKSLGWKLDVTTPDFPKSIICVAPHTSNWDFILGELAIRSVNRKSGFLMKEAWFFFPLGYIFRALGGIPVPKKKGSSLVEIIVDKFNNSEEMTLAVTPEGTRKLTRKWRTGFLYIALNANIPIQLAYIDFEKKEMGIKEVIYPTSNIDEDLRKIKNYYKNFTGKYPEKFTTEDEI